MRQRWKVTAPLGHKTVTRLFDSLAEAADWLDATESRRMPGQLPVVKCLWICRHDLEPHECPTCWEEANSDGAN